MSKLKPCPFCGNENLSIKIASQSDGYCSYEDYIISCKCGIRLQLPADGYYGREFCTEQEVADRWNSRNANE